MKLFANSEFEHLADRWTIRQQNLAYRAAYYDGTIYRNVRDRFTALGQLQAMLGPRLYRGTKALFLMLSRAVDVDVGIIPGDWAFDDDAPQAWEDATKQIFAWSDWEREGPLYVHYGAQYGLVGLKVCDLNDIKRIKLEVLDPSCFMLSRESTYAMGNTQAIILENRQWANGTIYEYAEVITADWIRTFADGQPYGFDGRPEAYPNPQGALPVIEVKHLHTGNELGECTYQKAIPLLDEVNELASYLADIIRKHAEAQWVMIGAEESEMTKSGDNVWFIPQGGDAKALVAQIDVAGVLAFVQEVRKQVEDALPETAFGELKSKTQIATATLEIQLMELVLKVKRTRPNYDHGLCDGLRLAGRSAKRMGLSNLAVLDDELLAFDKKRPVLPLDKKTELELEQLELALEAQRAISGQAEPAQTAAQPSTDPSADPNSNPEEDPNAPE